MSQHNKHPIDCNNFELLHLINKRKVMNHLEILEITAGKDVNEQVNLTISPIVNAVIYHSIYHRFTYISILSHLI